MGVLGIVSCSICASCVSLQLCLFHREHLLSFTFWDMRNAHPECRGAVPCRSSGSYKLQIEKNEEQVGTDTKIMGLEMYIKQDANPKTSHLSPYLLTSLPPYLSTSLPIYLSIYLSIEIPIYLPKMTQIWLDTVKYNDMT